MFRMFDYFGKFGDGGALDKITSGPWVIARLVVGALFMLACIAALIIGLILLIRYLRRPPEAPRGQSYDYMSHALRLLDERYAKGEIGDEEYLAKKANLKQ